MRKHELVGWGVVLLAALVVLAAGAHIVELLIGLKPDENQAVAAWVQAIGSIAAIGAGAWFIHHQSALALRHRRKAVLAIVDLALQTMGASSPIPDDDEEAVKKFVELSESRMRHAHACLTAIPLHEIDVPDISLAIGDASEVMRLAIDRQKPDRLAAAMHGTTTMKWSAKLYREAMMSLRSARERISERVG